MSAKKNGSGRTMPTLTFGSRSGDLEVSVGKRGRLQISGKGSFSQEEGWKFVERVQWYLRQMEPKPVPILQSGNEPLLSESGLGALDLRP